MFGLIYNMGVSETVVLLKLQHMWILKCELKSGTSCFIHSCQYYICSTSLMELAVITDTHGELLWQESCEEVLK